MEVITLIITVVIMIATVIDLTWRICMRNR